jgi:type II secretory pathway pseudopilin PulG
MNKQSGFTLIELIMFIIITGILGTTILLAFVYGLSKSPVASQNAIADLAASQCGEWFMGQRQLHGYSSITCTNPNTPAYCTANMPSGYTIVTSCAATTISSDSNYETLTVTVSGKGNAILTFVIGNY